MTGIHQSMQLGKTNKLKVGIKPNVLIHKEQSGFNAINSEIAGWSILRCPVANRYELMSNPRLLIGAMTVCDLARLTLNF